MARKEDASLMSPSAPICFGVEPFNSLVHDRLHGIDQISIPGRRQHSSTCSRHPFDQVADQSRVRHRCGQRWLVAERQKFHFHKTVRRYSIGLRLALTLTSLVLLSLICMSRRTSGGHVRAQHGNSTLSGHIALWQRQTGDVNKVVLISQRLMQVYRRFKCHTWHRKSKRQCQQTEAKLTKLCMRHKKLTTQQRFHSESKIFSAHLQRVRHRVMAFCRRMRRQQLAANGKDRAPLRSRHGSQKPMDDEILPVFYKFGASGPSDLPLCPSVAPANASQAVICGKVDTYGRWAEQMCQCGRGLTCPVDSGLSSSPSASSHTVKDGTIQYKTCQPVSSLPQCAYFTDTTRTLSVSRLATSSALEASEANSGLSAYEHRVHCRCPVSSAGTESPTYLVGHRSEGSRDVFTFACSPPTAQQCRRKQPCRLFTVSKLTKRRAASELRSSGSGRDGVVSVMSATVNDLCQCPSGSTCPTRHWEKRGGVSQDRSPWSASAPQSPKIYSAFCVA